MMKTLEKGINPRFSLSDNTKDKNIRRKKRRKRKEMATTRNIRIRNMKIV